MTSTFFVSGLEKAMPAASSNRWKRSESAAAGVITVCLACLLLLRASVAEGQQPSPHRDTAAPVSPPKFGFEAGPMEWVVQEYKDSRGCVRLAHSTERVFSGKGALEVVVQLIGGEPERSKGEVWVNLLESPPEGVTAPIDFRGRTLTARVYAPYGFRGSRFAPSGFQLFLKDANWKSYYGDWKNAIEGQWAALSLTLGPERPHSGFVEPGFDASKVIAIGVKMACGDGSHAKYEGSVFIDDVDW